MGRDGGPASARGGHLGDGEGLCRADTELAARNPAPTQSRQAPPVPLRKVTECRISIQIHLDTVSERWRDRPARGDGWEPSLARTGAGAVTRTPAAPRPQHPGQRGMG